MTKNFLTDKDVEELFHSGVKSLRVDDDVVLTDLAYEKALKLGMLVESDAPPAAPVRPYLSEAKKPPLRSQPEVDSVSSLVSQPILPPTVSWRSTSEGSKGNREAELEKRIREKVAAKLGDQVDATLLDTIIKRTLKVIRLK